jgi:tetratricopeptide (TPR) repeat protein
MSLLRSIAILLLEKAPFIALAAIGTLVAIASSVQSGVAKAMTDYTLAQRAAQAAYGLAFYLQKIVAPVALSPLYAIPPQLSPAAVLYVGCGALVVGLTVALLLLRRCYPALLAVWACFVIVLSPVLGLVQTGHQIAADRYTYLPAIGVSALISALILQVWVRSNRNVTRWAVVVALAAIIGVLCVLTWRQSLLWRNSETLWRHALSIEPDSAIALNNLGVVLTQAGRMDEAAITLERALAVDPTLADAHNNLGVIRATQGRLDEAMEHWRTVLERFPDDPDANENLREAHRLQEAR